MLAIHPRNLALHDTSALGCTLMHVQLGWFDITAIAFEELASLNDVLGEHVDDVAVEMGTDDDAQRAHSLGVGGHRVSREDPATLPHFRRDVELGEVFELAF